MQIKLKMDKAQFIVLYKWLKWKENLMSSDVTPEQNQSINSFLDSNAAIFTSLQEDKIDDRPLSISDVVKIVKRNIYQDGEKEYVVVQVSNSKFGLLPLDHIMNKILVQRHLTATPWRWFGRSNLKYCRNLTQLEKESFSKWKLSKPFIKRKVDSENSDSMNSLF